MKELLSIIAPMYNESSLVRKYCETVIEDMSTIETSYNLEIVLVNDGSSDNTLSIMHQLHNEHPNIVTIVNLSRNFGLEGAIKAGLSIAKGDIVVVMDADLQDPPSIIPSMIKKYEEGCDIVVAKRKKRASDSYFKRISALSFYRLLNSMSGKVAIEDNAANFRLLSRNALDKLLSLCESNFVFRVLVPFVGMKTGVVDYERDKRFAGETKFNLRSMLSFSFDGLTSISIKPLRCLVYTLPITVITFLLGIIGLVFAMGQWVLISAFLTIISFFSGIMFVCLCIIGEYLGQVMIEAKARPASIIQEHISCENAKGAGHYENG